MRFRSSFFAVITFGAAALFAAPERNMKTILFFGDSITIGYGLEASQAYPALVQEKIEAAKLPYRVVNAGLSGDTTAAGVERLRWTLKRKADVLVLALGANDGLRGIPPQTAKENLRKMIRLAREKNPDTVIVLAGMKMPPNYGTAYTEGFAKIYPQLAKEENVRLVPFLLDGVGGVDKFNLPDRIHPNAEGQALIAETVWKALKPVLTRE